MNLEKLIEYGVKAPSGHNTQPWLFSTRENEIDIHPDFSRALPAVDSDNHALYISLGCSAENIVIAAAKYGLQSYVSIAESKKSDTFIKIVLKNDDTLTENQLVNFIEKRQFTRNNYTERDVPSHDLDLLRKSFDFEGVDMITLTHSNEIEDLEPLIIEGSNLQFQNQDFINELVHWIRFSDREAKEKNDGLWAKCMGLPNIPRFIGSIFMKYFISAKSEAKRWKKLIDASAGFALFTVDTNDAAHWIKLGRAFQRFALTATKLNIHQAHVNMPCEELEVRQKLIEQFNLGSKHPLLLIRFGYSEKMPYSLRRDTEKVIL